MRRLSALLAVTALALAACSSPADTGTDGPADERPVVVVGLYPLAFLVESLAGDAVEVRSLAAPGVDPHDVELTPQQVVTVADADLVVLLPGLQPALDDAVRDLPAERVLDVTAGLPLLPASQDPHADEDHAEDGHADEDEDHSAESGTDPHVWLDPTQMTTMARAVSERLRTALGVDAAAGLAALESELATLDGEWRTGTATCRSRTLVVSHAAFGYLVRAYDLQQRPITLSPDIEASPADIKAVADFVRTNDVRTIYTEPLVSPALATTVSSSTGAATAVLDPLENITTGQTYLTVMRANLEAVRAGQGCS